jgi:DNA polymerase-3 subunit chi
MPLAVVEFHTGLADPAAFAARLLGKALRTGHRVQCAADAALRAQIDRLLWTGAERDFLPHALWPEAALPVLSRTPLWLVLQALPPGAAPRPGEPPAPAVLVNLAAPMPERPTDYERVIELVGTDADSVAAGRERWRAYKACGVEVRHHAPRP